MKAVVANELFSDFGASGIEIRSAVCGVANQHNPGLVVNLLYNACRQRVFDCMF